jgi:hypothetical protein
VKLLKFSLFICFFALAPSVLAQNLEMNDVSILMPLPELNEFNSLLNPRDQNGNGELLPYDVFRFLPVLTNGADQDSLYQNNLKVVGVRFDPCFGEGANPPACRKQIRLVWQPLIVVGNKTTTLDTAIHTFHEFSDVDWSLLMLELKARTHSFRKFSGSNGLQINPTLKNEGFFGTYWKSLRELITRYCGEKNLIRVTAMTVRQNRVWMFMGIDRTKTGWSLIKIPTLHMDPHPVSQSFFLMPDGLQNLEEFNGGASMLPAGQDLWFRLISDSKKVKETRSEPELKSIIRRAIQLENPKMNNPGTSDCVSCHLAQTVRLWGENNFPKWDWKKEFSKDRFQMNGKDLSNHSVNAFQTDRMRSFGYFGDDPIIAQRVIHETALVVDSLKKR